MSQCLRLTHIEAKAIPLHATKALGRRIIAPTHSRIRHKMWWAVSVMVSRALARGKNPRYPFRRGWMGPRAGVNKQATGKILSPLPGIEPRSRGRPTRSQTLHWLSYPGTPWKCVICKRLRLIYIILLTCGRQSINPKVFGDLVSLTTLLKLTRSLRRARTRRFITAFTTPSHRPLSWATSIHSTLCSSLSVRDQVSHPYKTTGTIMEMAFMVPVRPKFPFKGARSGWQMSDSLATAFPLEEQSETEFHTRNR
jgi:hypothetical protein